MGLVSRFWWKGPGWRHLRILVPVATLLAIGTGLAFGWIYLHKSDCSKISCAFPLGVVTTGFVAAAGIVAFFVTTRTLALRSYLKVVRQRGWMLLDMPEGWLDENDAPVPRDDLAKAVAFELRAGNAQNGADRNAQRQYLSGSPGSGKTTFLLGLAKWLAARGAVPVLVPLHDETPPLDLAALARERFLRAVGGGPFADAAADRLWRQLCLSHRVVILADGLDEAAQSAPTLPLADLVRPQPARDLGWRLPIAISARPSALADKARTRAFDLSVWPLEQDDVIDYLSKAPDLQGRESERLVELLGLRTEPFYLQVLTGALGEPGADELLDQLEFVDGSRELARVRLLAYYFDSALKARAERSDQPNFEEALRVASQVALDALLEGDSTTSGDDGGGSAERTLRERRALTVASRLGILEIRQVDGERDVRFSHPIVRAYLASAQMQTKPRPNSGDSVFWRKLLASVRRRTEPPPNSGDTAPWRRLLSGGGSEEARLAVRMFAAVAPPDLRLTVIAELIGAETAPQDPALRLVHAATAARIATCGPLDPDPVPRICVVVRATWKFAGQAAQVAAVRALGEVAHVSAYELLWELALGEGYEVRWELVEILATAGATAWEALKPSIDTAIDEIKDNAKTIRSADPEQAHAARSGLDATLPQLSVVAKFLPAMIDASGPPGAEETLKTLIELVREIKPHGLGTEASLAQGFKRAAASRTGAKRSASERVKQIEDLLTNAQFWYSRINALQALARVGAALGTDQVDKQLVRSATAVINRGRGDPHPLVRATAKLAKRAIKTSNPRLYVWHDESVEMRRSGEGRARTTSQLVADVVLILNMNEQRFGQGPEAKERLDDTHANVGTCSRLPACIDGDRERLLERKEPDPCTCGFHLCPYVWGDESAWNVTLEHAHRGHPSAPFCRHQRQLLTGHLLPAWLGWAPNGLGRPTSWRRPRPGSKSSLHKFWTRMEEIAANHDQEITGPDRI